MSALRLALVAALLFAPLSARAGDDVSAERARLFLRAGIAHYAEGRFEDALREMEAARRLHPGPDLEYNVAQCLESLGRYGEAAAAYRSYLGARGTPDERRQLEAHVAELESRPAPAPTPTPAPRVVKEVVWKTVVVYRTAPPPPGRGARWAAIGLSAFGAAALAAWIGTLVVAQRDLQRVSDAGSTDAPVVYDGALRDADGNQRTLQIVSWVSLGVAALSIGGAAGLFVLGRRIDREAPKLSLAPFGLGGAALQVRF